MGFFTFLRSNARLAAFGFAFCLLSSAGQTYFISLFGGELRAEFGLSHGGFGTVYMAGTLASAATLIMLGRVVDVWPAWRTALMTLSALSAVAVFMGFVWGPVAMAVAIYGLRLMGQGMSVHIGVTTMARSFVAERGRAVSVASLGQAAGSALSPPYVVALLAVMSWREAWWVTAALVLAALPLTLWLVRGQPAPNTAGPSGDAKKDADGYRLKDMLADPGFWLRLPVLVAPAFISTGFVFHQVHIAAEKSWPIELMAASYTAYAGALVFGLLSAGSLIDRFSARRVVPFCLTPLALSSLTLAIADAHWMVPAYLMLLGLATGLSGVMQGALWAELYGTQHIGAIRSFAASLTVFSSGLAPAVMGLGFDAGADVATIAVAGAAYCVAASAVAATAKRPRRLRTAPASPPA